MIAARGMKKELFMYPYKARRTKFLGGLLKLLNGRGKSR